MITAGDEPGDEVIQKAWYERYPGAVMLGITVFVTLFIGVVGSLM